MAIGDMIEELRRDAGLTQEEVGKALHVSKSAVYGYECGRSTPPMEAIIKLSDLFQVNSDYLLGRTKIRIDWDKLYKEIYISDQPVSAQAVIEKLQNLSPENRKFLIKILDALILQENYELKKANTQNIHLML